MKELGWGANSIAIGDENELLVPPNISSQVTTF